MHRLHTERSVPRNRGEMHLVRLPSDVSIPSWLVHAQIELDGKRVFVRMVDTTAISEESGKTGMVGLVVAPVY